LVCSESCSRSCRSFSSRQSDAKDSLDALNDQINAEDLVLELSLYCNRDFAKMGHLLAEMQTLMRVLLESVFRALDLVSCERVVPIYHKAVYDGACRYSVNGVMWVFAASLVMAISGLIMLLFRSAYKPVQYAGAADYKEVSANDEDIDIGYAFDEASTLSPPKTSYQNTEVSDSDDYDEGARLAPPRTFTIASDSDSDESDERDRLASPETYSDSDDDDDDERAPLTMPEAYSDGEDSGSDSDEGARLVPPPTYSNREDGESGGGAWVELPPQTTYRDSEDIDGLD